MLIIIFGISAVGKDTVSRRMKGCVTIGESKLLLYKVGRVSNPLMKKETKKEDRKYLEEYSQRKIDKLLENAGEMIQSLSTQIDTVLLAHLVAPRHIEKELTFEKLEKPKWMHNADISILLKAPIRDIYKRRKKDNKERPLKKIVLHQKLVDEKWQDFKKKATGKCEVIWNRQGKLTNTLQKINKIRKEMK